MVVSVQDGEVDVNECSKWRNISDVNHHFVCRMQEDTDANHHFNGNECSKW
jgi:hypothetical protein